MDSSFFLAQAFSEQVKAATHGPRFDSRDMLLGATIVLLIGFAIFLIIYLRSRKKSDLIDQERLSQMTRSTSTSVDSNERRRKRRRRRAHRPRNPSLDKTGGLPPPRSDDQLPKY